VRQCLRFGERQSTGHLAGATQRTVDPV
jgi:hypothetical protein